MRLVTWALTHWHFLVLYKIQSENDHTRTRVHTHVIIYCPCGEKWRACFSGFLIERVINHFHIFLVLGHGNLTSCILSARCSRGHTCFTIKSSSLATDDQSNTLLWNYCFISAAQPAVSLSPLKLYWQLFIPPQSSLIWWWCAKRRCRRSAAMANHSHFYMKKHAKLFIEDHFVAPRCQLFRSRAIQKYFSHLFLGSKQHQILFQFQLVHFSK